MKLPALIRAGVSVLGDAATVDEVADRIAWVLLAGSESGESDGLVAELGELNDRKLGRWRERWGSILSPDEGLLLAGVSRTMLVDAVAAAAANGGGQPLPRRDDGLEDAFSLAERPGRFDTRPFREAIVRQLALELGVTDILQGGQTASASPEPVATTRDDSWGIRGKRRSANAAQGRPAQAKG